jgi:hypothetical protein
MTALLEKAFSKIKALPPEEQNALAALIFEEMESEKKWDKLFTSSQDQLAKLAKQAVADYQTGKTTPLDPDRDL